MILFSLSVVILLFCIILFAKRKRIKKIPKYWTDYEKDDGYDNHENIYS